MGVSQGSIDAALEDIRDNAERLVLLSSEPSVYADVATFELADVAVAVGDFTIAAGDVSGRKLTLAAKTVTGSANGTATHYALVDDTGTRLLLWHTMTNVAIENGVTQDVQEVDAWEIQDPT